MPPDPFLPDDPKARESALVQYITEAKDLTLAFGNMGSQSSLVEALHSVHEAIVEWGTQVGLTSEEAAALWLAWLIDPPTDATLDEVIGGPEGT
jgi:hypothetical protein